MVCGRVLESASGIGYGLFRRKVRRYWPIMKARTASARRSIIEAFNRLVLARRDPRPPIAEVLDAAGVAKSTFYEHFDGRDGLLIESLKPPLSIIADAAAGVGDPERLQAILEHFGEQRRAVADLLCGPLAPRFVRALAALIRERTDLLSANAALQLADMQIGYIRLWVTREAPSTARDLAATMIKSAAAQRNISA